jgi:hypothetical protein
MKPVIIILTLLILLLTSCCGYHENGIRYSILGDLHLTKQIGYFKNNTNKTINFEIWSIRPSYFEYKCSNCNSLMVYNGLLSSKEVYELKLKSGWYLVKVKLDGSKQWKLKHSQLKYKKNEEPFIWDLE